MIRLSIKRKIIGIALILNGAALGGLGIAVRALHLGLRSASGDAAGRG